MTLLFKFLKIYLEFSLAFVLMTLEAPHQLHETSSKSKEKVFYFKFG
jgi:hypothetical protein